MSAMYGAMFAALLMVLFFSATKFARRMYNGRRIRLDRIEVRSCRVESSSSCVMQRLIGISWFWMKQAAEPVGISTPLIRDNQAFNEKRHVMFGM